MSPPAVIYPSSKSAVLSADAAHTHFLRILQALLDGAQCPCSLATVTGIDESTLFAYLAELRSREWIQILPDSGLQRLRHRTSKDIQSSDHLLKNLALARKAHDQAAQQGLPKDVLFERARIWYDFFRRQEEAEALADIVLYVHLTEKGRKQLQNI